MSPDRRPLRVAIIGSGNIGTDLMIKVERSPALEEGSDLVLLQIMVQLGRAFDLKVVAEGIDTDRKLRRIQQLGCHFGQGFLFARPAPFEQVMRRFRETSQPRPDANAPIDAVRS